MHESILSYDVGVNIAAGTIVYALLQQVCQAPFQITTFTVLPKSETPKDAHQVKEIWLIQSGTGVLTYENQTYTVNKNNVFYFAPHKQHQIKNIGDTLLKILSIYW